MPRTILAFALAAFALNALADGPPVVAAPENVQAVGRIAPASEPGERMIVTGQLFAPDGTTPVAGAIVYAYQTDNKGEYHNDSRGVARLHGWAKTDANGRFEFHTIRPAAYPERRFAAHIHINVYGATYPLQWTPAILFADDPLLSERERRESAELGQKFANIRPVRRDADGTWRCHINFRLSKTSNYPGDFKLLEK